MAVGKKTRKPGPGRESKYKPEYAAQALVVCSEAGFSSAKLAKLFGVGKATIHEWQVKHQEFAKAVADGKDVFASDKVEKSLYKRALGYKIEEKTFAVPDPENEDESLDVTGEERKPVLLRVVIKEVPPDVAAIRYFLNNRRPDRWKEKQTVSHEGSIGLSWEDLLKKAAEKQ